ncbi:hypothetical protein OSTOST_04747 [Ostertagia ostertagi]
MPEETLIVWSESDTCDLALSFQEKSGCEEIWAKICEVQGRDPGDSDGGYDEMDDGELSEGSSNALSTTGAAGRVILPPIEIGRLSEVDSVIQNHLATQALREKMANAVESESVLPKLVDVFHMCEDVEHKDGLRTLYSIAKNLFMLNRNSLNETLLSEKYLKDLIGMLEYDPAHEAPRKHREFLYEKATFREVLPIANDELKEKIHQTYRVQYLQDVCLPAPSLFEENLLSVLNSYLFFNRIDIVNMLQKDKRLMKELFDQLRDPETTVSRRRDLAFFLKEFISLSQGLPPNGAQSKDNFFKVNRWLCISMEKIHQTYRVQYLQDVCLPAPSLFEENLLSVLNSYLFFNRIDIVNMLQKDKRLMKELFDQLRDPETTVSRRRDLAFFLKEFISLSQGLPPNGAQSKDNFFKNLQANDVLGTIEPCIKSPDPDTRITIVDMLALLVEHSPQLVRDYLLRQAKDKSDDEVLLNRLLIHMQTDRDPELTSGSQVSQVLRTLLDPDNMVSMQKSDRSEFLSLFYQRSIYTLVKPMMDNVKGGTIKRDDYCTANRQSLVVRLLCFCIEHHSFSMRQHCISNDLLNKEDIKPLVKYTVENHMSSFEDVTYVKLFSELKIRYEQQRDRENSAKITADERVPSPAAFAKERQEEQWFDGEDDDATECKKEPIEVKKEIKKEIDSPRKTGIEPMFPSVLKRKNAFDEDDGAVFSGQVALLTPVNIVTEKKIVIKVGDRSRTPSPLGSPLSSTPPPPQAREDEVSSSQNNSKENSPMSIKEEQWFDGEDDDATECKKEPIEVKKEIKKEIDSPRKTGIEPMFPSVLKRKNAFDEDDGAVFSGQVALLTPVNIVTEKKIVIKVGDRSRTPSPLGSPLSSTPPPPQAREDEVSSSQNNSKENSPMSIKSLVDYDESDSDEDENSAPNDSIPSSSTGSPVQMSSSIEKGAESTTAAPATSSGGDLSPCDDDVSSTSGEEESAAGGCGLTRRKRPSRSDIDEEVVKRSRASPET